MKIIEFYGLEPGCDLTEIIDVSTAVKVLSSYQRNDGSFDSPPNISRDILDYITNTTDTILGLYLVDELNKIDSRKAGKYLVEEINRHTQSEVFTGGCSVFEQLFRSLLAIDILNNGKQLDLKSLEKSLEGPPWYGWTISIPFVNELRVLIYLGVSKFKQSKEPKKDDYHKWAQTSIPTNLKLSYLDYLKHPEKREENMKGFCMHIDASFVANFDYSRLTIIGNVLGEDISEYKQVANSILETFEEVTKNLDIYEDKFQEIFPDLLLLRSALKLYEVKPQADEEWRKRLRHVDFEELAKKGKCTFNGKSKSGVETKPLEIIQLANLIESSQ